MLLCGRARPAACAGWGRPRRQPAALTNRVKVLNPGLQVPQQDVVQDGALIRRVALLCGHAAARQSEGQRTAQAWTWAADAGGDARGGTCKEDSSTPSRSPLAAQHPPSQAHSRHTHTGRPGGGPAPPLRSAPCRPRSSAGAPQTAPCTGRTARAGRCWGQSTALRAGGRGAAWRQGAVGGRGVQAGPRRELLKLPSSGQQAAGSGPAARPAHRQWTMRQARWWGPTEPG